MPDVISDTNGKLCVGSYHMWRLLSSPDNYSFISLWSLLSCGCFIPRFKSVRRERTNQSLNDLLLVVNLADPINLKVNFCSLVLY